MDHALCVSLNLFFAGLLAGIEFIVRFGVRHPIGVLAPGPQIRFRQALIRSLRVSVPIIFLCTLVSAAAVIVFEPSLMRYAAATALLVWILATFAGTVPINKAVLAWNAEAPPANWQAKIRAWERLDTLRTLAALLVFALLLAATVHMAAWPHICCIA